MEGVVWPMQGTLECAMLLSQCGPLAAEQSFCVPSTRETKFDSQLFRLLLLRRFCLPALDALDVLGHQRSSCATVEVLGRRNF